MINSNHAYNLTREEVEQYLADGFVLVKGVLRRDEALELRKESNDLFERIRKSGNLNAVFSGWNSATQVYKGDTQLLHCHNPQFHCSSFTKILLDARIVDRAASLIGENVQLHHAKLFIKPPEKGAPFPMHQDYPFFPHQKNSLIAAVLHLDDAPPEKGCLRMIPGSHSLGPLEHIAEGGWHLPTNKFPLSQSVACPAEAGDVLFFHYLTVHGSNVNVAKEARTTLLIQMRDPTDSPLEPVHLSRGQGMMLKGIDPLADADVGPESASRILRALTSTH